METFKVLVPEYYNDFKCKCGDCRKLCCDGWGIVVSRSEYFRLLGIDCEKRLRNKLDDAFAIVKDPSEERYASIHPNYLGNCPLLDENGLCMLHKEMGEDVLPLICRLYPRSIKSYGDMHELCVSDSCEKTIELLMSDKEPMKLHTEELTLPFDGIKIYENDKEKDAVRHRAIETVISGRESFSEKLFILGKDICGEEKIQKHSGGEALRAIMSFTDIIRKHSASIAECSEKAFAYLEGTSGEDAYRLYKEAERHLYGLIPAIETYASNIIANHMMYEGFPYVPGCSDIDSAYCALCSSSAMLRFLYVCGTYDSTDEKDFVDICASAHRFIEHTDYYGLTANRKHPKGSEVYALFAPLFEM